MAEPPILGRCSDALLPRFTWRRLKWIDAAKMCIVSWVSTALNTRPPVG